MRIVTPLLLSAIVLLGCTDLKSDERPPFDFGGVYENSVAGAIDRTRTTKRQDGPPNIVLIIADDLGWPYLGFLGDKTVHTPNMDVIGEGGYVFELGYATANHCAPTLRTLISGLNTVQWDARATAYADAEVAKGVPPAVDTAREEMLYRRQQETSFIETVSTLPRILADRGYVSHQSGKWWEQSYRHGGFTHGMTEGWEWKDAAELGDRWFFTYMGGYGNEIGRETMAPVTDFIEAHAEEPFFLWYGPALPHTPLNPPARFYKFFENRADLSETAKLYYANIAWFDWGVGQLMDSLEANGALENTIIVYINDNGWQQDPITEYRQHPIHFPNGGPKGKASFFETAFRTPIIFYAASMIEAGRDTTTLASAIDVMPTILDYAGAPVAEGLPGRSLRPLIEGQEVDEREVMITRVDRHRAGTNIYGQPLGGSRDVMGVEREAYVLRDRRYHFVWLPKTGETILYDMIDDPDQTRDASTDHPDRIAQYREQIELWRNRFEQD